MLWTAPRDTEALLTDADHANRFSKGKQSASHFARAAAASQAAVRFSRRTASGVSTNGCLTVPTGSLTS